MVFYDIDKEILYTKIASTPKEGWGGKLLGGPSSGLDSDQTACVYSQGGEG